MFQWSVVKVSVTVAFLYVKFHQIPLKCTSANEYPSSDDNRKVNIPVRGDCFACDGLLII